MSVLISAPWSDLGPVAQPHLTLQDAAYAQLPTNTAATRDGVSVGMAVYEHTLAAFQLVGGKGRQRHDQVCLTSKFADAVKGPRGCDTAASAAAGPATPRPLRSS